MGTQVLPGLLLPLEYALFGVTAFRLVSAKGLCMKFIAPQRAKPLLPSNGKNRSLTRLRYSACDKFAGPGESHPSHG